MYYYYRVRNACSLNTRRRSDSVGSPKIHRRQLCDGYFTRTVKIRPHYYALNQKNCFYIISYKRWFARCNFIQIRRLNTCRVFCERKKNRFSLTIEKRNLQRKKKKKESYNRATLFFFFLSISRRQNKIIGVISVWKWDNFMFVQLELHSTRGSGFSVGILVWFDDTTINTYTFVWEREFQYLWKRGNINSTPKKYLLK